MSEERRLVPRYPLTLPIVVGDVRGMTRNFSLEGALFVSPALFPIGETIRITVVVGRAFDDAMRVEGSGVVLRCDPDDGHFLTAVKFDALRVLTDAPGRTISTRTT